MLWNNKYKDGLRIFIVAVARTNFLAPKKVHFFFYNDQHYSALGQCSEQARGP